jgi:hypothetical protein
LAAHFSPQKLSRNRWLVKIVEKWAVKRKQERIQWRIEQNGGRVLKTLEDPETEDVRKILHRQTVLPYEGTLEKVGFGSRECAEVSRYQGNEGKPKFGLQIRGHCTFESIRWLNRATDVDCAMDCLAKDAHL